LTTITLPRQAEKIEVTAVDQRAAMPCTGGPVADGRKVSAASPDW